MESTGARESASRVRLLVSTGAARGVRGERGRRLLAAARYFQFALSFPSSSRAG